MLAASLPARILIATLVSDHQLHTS